MRNFLTASPLTLNILSQILSRDSVTVTVDAVVRKWNQPYRDELG